MDIFNLTIKSESNLMLLVASYKKKLLPQFKKIITISPLTMAGMMNAELAYAYWSSAVMLSINFSRMNLQLGIEIVNPDQNHIQTYFTGQCSVQMSMRSLSLLMSHFVIEVTEIFRYQTWIFLPSFVLSMKIGSG